RMGRKDATDKTDFVGVDIPEPGKVPLVEEGDGRWTLRCSFEPGESFGSVPVLAEQIGSQMTDDGVFILTGDELDDSQVEPDTEPLGRTHERSGLERRTFPARTRL